MTLKDFDPANGRLPCPEVDVHPEHTWDSTTGNPDEWTCSGLGEDDVRHIGRSWDSHPLEDECPCPQEACGLVARNRVSPDCDQHPPLACKTIRQSHRAGDCPGRTRVR